MDKQTTTAITNLWYRFLPLLTALVLGCGEGGPPLAARELGIANGVFEAGYPSVGLLKTGTSHCTGTLVGQRTVLTAAHCIGGMGPYTFLLGGVDYGVAQTTVHHKYGKDFFGFLEHDVAVVQLLRAPPVAPTRVSARAPDWGAQVTLVGYGKTSKNAADPGIKRSARNNVLFKGTQTLTYFSTLGDRGNICDGDSGGPTFATFDGQEAQVGVHSSGSLLSCSISGTDMRTDIYISWLTQAAGGDIEIIEPVGVSDDPPATDDVVVKILSPQDAAQVVSPVKLHAEVATRYPILRVDLRVDGLITATSAEAPFVFEPSLAPGEHVLSVEAHDAAGGYGTDQLRITVIAPSAVGDTPPANDPVATDPDPATTPTGTGEDGAKIDLTIRGGCRLGAAGQPLLPLPVGLLLLWLLSRRRRRPGAPQA